MVKDSHKVPVPKHKGKEIKIKLIYKILSESNIPKENLLKWLGR
jgi:predicted RNA binding protein YcfA (HicA-like mRNA interferase family)